MNRQVPNLSRKQLSQVALSDTCKSIIYGSLLGDGSLRIAKGYKHARLSIRHSQCQQEYFEWKARQLKEIASPKSVQFSPASGYSSKQKLLFQSRACEQLTQIHQLSHVHNRLHIRRGWLNHCTALSLAVWWCDDGSIIGRGRKGVLCTDGFDQASVILLASYLQKVWGIQARAAPIKRDRKYGDYSQSYYYRVWFGTEALKQWLRIVMPYIGVSSMVRKAKLIYTHPELQQRWISEMKEAMPTFQVAIDRLYAVSENDIVQTKSGELPDSG